MKNNANRKRIPFPPTAMILLSLFVCLQARSQWTQPDGSGNITNTNSGSVGIGTGTSPGYKLDVNGYIHSHLMFVCDVPSPGNVGGWFRGATNGNANVVIQGGAGNYGAWWLTGAGVFKIGGTGSTEPATGAINITSTGNVGIGTTGPAAPLEVYGGQLGGTAGNTYEMTRIDGFTPNYSQIRFSLNRYNSVNDWTAASTRIQAWTDVTPQGYIDFNPNSGLYGIAFGTNNTELMRITQQGNVLIGKTSQVNTGYLLDVNGNGRLNQVVVNTTGADYVFDASYHLTPLKELATYIHLQHHLPGIAPAAQMQKDGLDIGENQTRLLAKVEELTLYLIKLEKQNEAQQKRIRQLEQRNHTLESLEQRIERLERSSR